MAFDGAGNLFVADISNNRIRKITISTGLISTIAGTGTFGYNGDGILATTAQLAGCAYIKFDAAENMFIGEGSNQRVREIIKSTGVISTIAGTGTAGYNGDGIPATTAQLNFPFYILFDQAKCNMYIADYYNNRIRLITGGFIGCTPLPLNSHSFKGKKKDQGKDNSPINIYPNPGNGSIWLTSSAMIGELKISNLSGQIIYQVRPDEKNLKLQLDKAGIYFIQISTATQRITQKLIVYK